MKKIVSLALFGEGTRYVEYARAWVRAHLTLFPIAEGWELRVHHDVHNGGGFLRVLSDRGLVRLVERESAPLTRAMLWRMCPVWDPEADYVFPRDIDALPTPRDRACCESFIASGCDVQMVHDSKSHDGVMGGMGGYACESFREVSGIASWEDLVAFGGKTDAEWAKHGTDQEVLNALCLGWQMTGGSHPAFAIFEHRYAGWASGKPGLGARTPVPVACVSELVPDVGHLFQTEERTREADALVSHLGAAGFDTERAIAFYDRYGDPTVKVIQEAERESA